MSEYLLELWEVHQHSKVPPVQSRYLLIEIHSDRFWKLAKVKNIVIEQAGQ